MPRIGSQLALLDALDDVGEHGVGAGGDAHLLALAHHVAVEVLDLGAAALLHVLAHRRALLGRHLAAVLDALLVAGPHRRLVALAGPGDGIRGQMHDLLQLVAVRLADADRLAAEPGREAADGAVLQHLGAGQPRAGGKPVAHDVGDELRPALPPQVGRDHGAVGSADQPAHLLDALGDAAMHLAGAEHGVRLAALAGAAVDVTGSGQVDEDGAGDAAERLAPTDHAGNGLLV